MGIEVTHNKDVTGDSKEIVEVWTVVARTGRWGRDIDITDDEFGPIDFNVDGLLFNSVIAWEEISFRFFVGD